MMVIRQAGNTYFALWSGKCWLDRAGHKWYQSDTNQAEQNPRASRMFSREHGSTHDWQADRPVSEMEVRREQSNNDANQVR